MVIPMGKWLEEAGKIEKNKVPTIESSSNIRYQQAYDSPRLPLDS